MAPSSTITPPLCLFLRGYIYGCSDKPTHLTLTCGPFWMNVERSLTTVCPVVPSLTNHRKRAYPGAIHSRRFYHPEWEEEIPSLEKVGSYLAQGRWFRGVRSNGFFGGGRYQYYLGKHFAKLSVALRFDPEAMVLICFPQGCKETIQLPVQGVQKPS
jgi:hypothetical protein